MNLTKEQILNMQPDKELDALVATDVMGFKIENVSSDTCTIWDGTTVRYFEPSTDISAAWEVLDRFNGFQISKMPIGEHKGKIRAFIDKNVNCAYGNAASEAICKAALLAIGGEQENE